MSDAMFLEGKEYISSKRAAELSGYAQDYVGQLARKGLIDARRVGGLWYVTLGSLTEYKSHAEAYVPQQPEREVPIQADSLIAFDGKDHISASHAAKMTGYHPDYVGQLARSGAIISRQVGNRWYIDREGILAHKREKDRMLGSVQAQSVGVVRNDAKGASEGHHDSSEPFFTYTSESGDLLPNLAATEAISSQKVDETEQVAESDEGVQEYVVPIRKLHNPADGMLIVPRMQEIKHEKRAQVAKKSTYGATIGKLAVSALTIVIVLSFGFVTLKNSSIYGVETNQGGSILQRKALAAGAAETLHGIQSFLEDLFSKDLIYRRGQ